MKRWTCLLVTILWTGVAAQLADAQRAATPAPAEELRLVADRLLAEGKLDEARPIYLRLVAADPRNFQINRNLGQCFANGRRPDFNRAIEFFQAALALEDAEDVRIALARAYIGARRPEAGLRLLRELAAQHPQHLQHWREYAEQLDAAGQPTQAVDAYRAYLERRPGDNLARLELARLLTWQRDATGAMAEFRIVLQSNPRNIPARIGVARLLGWESRLEDSLRGFEDVLAEAPQNAEALQGKGQVLHWMGRLDEAEQIFQGLARRFPNNPELRAALDDIDRTRRASAAPVAIAPQQPPATVEGYQARAAQNPNDREAQQWLAEYYAARQEWPVAVRHMREVVRLGRDDATEFRLAQLLARAGSYDDAASLLRGLAQRSPTPAVDLELAAALRWSGHPEEALPLLDRVLEGTPSDPDALAHRSQVRTTLGRHREALEDFDRLLAQRPADADALIGKANASASLGDFEAALRVLSTVPPELAGNAQIALTRQRLETEARDRQEQQLLAAGGEGAERVLRAWLARNPADADAAYSLGERAAARNNYAEAVNFFRQALEARPDMRAARLRLAQVLSFNRSYEDSVTEYDRILRENPRDAEALLESARVRSWAENYSDSAARYRRYLEIQPDPEAQLQLARVSAAARQYENALGQLDALAQTMPSSREVMLERGQALLALGRNMEAMLHYDAALARFPNDIEMLYGKGRALYYLGSMEEADRVLSLAHQSVPDHADVTFTLANVARARGKAGRALDLIQPDTSHAESRELRANILSGLRPELRLLFSGEHSTEFLTGRAIQPDLGLRTYRGNARLSFWLTPEVRAQLDFNSIPSFAGRGSFLGGMGDSFVSNNVLFTLSGAVSPRIRWTAGGGGNAQSSGTEKLLGLASVSVQTFRNSTLTLEADRMMIDYTPRAVALNVSRNEYRALWDVLLQNFLRLSVNYARANYSTGNHSNLGSGTVEVLVPTRGGGNVALGYTYQAVGFTRAFNAGFFTPELSQRYALSSRYSGRLASAVQYELHGSLGPQKATFVEGDPRLDDFTLGGTVGGSINWNLTEAATLGAGYDYAKTAYATGAYRSHSFLVFWRFRF